MKFYKSLWFWCVIIGLLCCAGNVAYAIWGWECNKSNILTVISGWVSGLATLAVGCIAFFQSRKFAFLTQKTTIINKIEEERRLFLAELLNVSKCWPTDYIDFIGKTIYSYLLAKLGDLQNNLFHFINMANLCQFIPNNMVDLRAFVKDSLTKCATIQKDINDTATEKTMLDVTKKLLEIQKVLFELKIACCKEYDEKITEFMAINNFAQLQKRYDEIIVQSNSALNQPV